MPTKICKSCQEEKDLNEFPLCGGDRQGHRSKCFKCAAAQAKQYRKAQPEKVKATWKKFNQKHKIRRCEYQKNRNHQRKFKVLALWSNYKSNKFHSGEKITAFDLFKIAKKQKLICPITGDKLTKENISVDHIIPYDKGGRNTPDNIQLVTWEANNAKQALLLDDFYKLIKKIHNYQQTKS